jgi:exopolysaccharide biosynthesis protein
MQRNIAMPVKQAARRLTHLLFVWILASLLLACALVPNLDVGSGSTPTDTASSNSLLNRWSQVAPGIEVRDEHWKSTDSNEDTVMISRFDPHQLQISVGYQPSNPLSLVNWQKQTGAIALFNGGYFDQNNRATALTISNGQSYGTSYPDFGGLFAVDTQGNVILRSLKQQPYDPDTEQLQQATESSPMLVIDGKRTNLRANSSRSRRTVVALDTDGRLLFIISPGRSFTLGEMAEVVSSSDLHIQTALNLDGGASTGMYIKTKNQNLGVDSVSNLPIVIYMHPLSNSSIRQNAKKTFSV